MPSGLPRHPHFQYISAGPATGPSRQEAKIPINATAARRLLVTVAAIGTLLWAPTASARAIGALPANEVSCVALNIYHEARGEPVAGRLAVGHVVLNRVRDTYFPNRACAVISQGGEKPGNGCQFSWWCDGRSDRPRDAIAWREAVGLAKQIYAGRTADPTGGALWYHADYVNPGWGEYLARGPRIGHHIFYRRGLDGAIGPGGEGKPILGQPRHPRHRPYYRPQYAPRCFQDKVWRYLPDGRIQWGIRTTCY